MHCHYHLSFVLGFGCLNYTNKNCLIKLDIWSFFHEVLLSLHYSFSVEICICFFELCWIKNFDNTLVSFTDTGKNLLAILLFFYGLNIFRISIEQYIYLWSKNRVWVFQFPKSETKKFLVLYLKCFFSPPSQMILNDE